MIYIYLRCHYLISVALCHCPADRHSAATPEVQKEEEKKFKEVGEAFTVLSDPKKKVRYDNGHDLDDDGCFDGRGMFLQVLHIYLGFEICKHGIQYVKQTNLSQGSAKLNKWLFLHVVPPADPAICAFVSSLDFDANNIFRAFFGGHGGGFSFDASPGRFFCVYTPLTLLKHVRITNRKRTLLILSFIFSFFLDSGPGNFFFQFG